MRYVNSILCLLATLYCTPSDSQTDAPVDPSSVTVPDLSFQPTARDIEGYDRHFYFHKPGITVQTALVDIKDCSLFSSRLTPMGRIPRFAPLDAEPPSRGPSAAWNVFPMYGPIGVVIVAFAMDEIASAVKSGNLRRCMGYKGYQRFGTSKKNLVRNYGGIG